MNILYSADINRDRKALTGRVGKVVPDRTRLVPMAIILGLNPRKDEMPRKDERLAIPALGEYYNDLLHVDASINGRTKVVQAQSLLCAKLQERDKLIKQRVEYLAKKRGITFDEMWAEILNNTAQKIVSGEEGLEYTPGDEG
ncbi:hypothetical protein [Nostoc sp.]|uniref:hypothetical protein n=1 Tax=Nostoc sp. TaxID=1180 RepID=UPI002FF50CD3